MPEAPAARRRDRPSATPRTSLTGKPGALSRRRDVDRDAEVREAPHEHGVLRRVPGSERYAELEELAPAGGDPYRRIEGVLPGRQVGQALNEPGGDARRDPVGGHTAD